MFGSTAAFNLPRTLSACAIAVLLGVAASPGQQAEAADYSKFNGVYAGIHGGYSSGQIGLHDSRIGGMDVGVSGFFGGIHAGYGHNIFDRVYIGAEVEHNRYNNAIGDAFVVDFKKKYDYSASLRLGFLAGEDTMVYTKLGAHHIEMSADGRSENAGGVKAGIGIEYIVWKHLSVRAEGVYTHMSPDEDLKPVEDAHDTALILGMSLRF